MHFDISIEKVGKLTPLLNFLLLSNDVEHAKNYFLWVNYRKGHSIGKTSLKNAAKNQCLNFFKEIELGCDI